MNSTLSLLLVFLNQFFMPRHNAQLRLLKTQIQILRTRVPTQRIILSPEEKAELLRIGAECGHDIDGLMEVAKPATYKRWLAQMRGGRPFNFYAALETEAMAAQLSKSVARKPAAFNADPSHERFTLPWISLFG